jgi:hypothetical protein
MISSVPHVLIISNKLGLNAIAELIALSKTHSTSSARAA